MTPASNRGFIPQCDSTADPPQGIPLYLRRDGDDFHVSDVVGVRYGHGRTVKDAMEMWMGDVEWLCKEPSERLGGALLKEQRRYVAALRYFKDGAGGI